MWIINHLLKVNIFKQFVKFCVVGTANTFLDFLVYIFLNRIIGLYYLLANLFSILVAMTSSFIFNKYWTFRNIEKDIKTQYLKFALVNGIFFILYNSLFYLFVEIIGIYDLIAKAMTIFICLFWNFFANRHFTFRKQQLKISSEY